MATDEVLTPKLNQELAELESTAEFAVRVLHRAGQAAQLEKLLKSIDFCLADLAKHRLDEMEPRQDRPLMQGPGGDPELME